MSANDWVNIDNNVDTFIFGIETTKNNWLSSNKSTVNIGQVKNGKGISFNVKVPIENNDKTIVNIVIIPIIPEGKKYLKMEEKQYFIIKKIFPEFKGKSLVTYNKPNIPF